MIPTNVKQLWYSWTNSIWWRFVPGVEVKVKWPVGWTRPDDHGVSTNSADPNDHYRPWMEKHVGRQNIDWQWDLRDNDCADNTLTIKIRTGKKDQASIIALMWS